jgi:hypothetical protein
VQRSHEFGLWEKGEELHRELTSREIPMRSEVRPQDLTGGHMVEA